MEAEVACYFTAFNVAIFYTSYLKREKEFYKERVLEIVRLGIE